MKTSNNYTSLIDDIVAGRWFNSEKNAYAKVPYKSIVFAKSLAGKEADLVASLGFKSPFAIVADPATYKALGHRVQQNLQKLGTVKKIILEHPHADMATVHRLRQALAGINGIVAVGSGTINDLCKYATYLNNQSYCVFATAASMNGYTSTTASITLASGLKVSFLAHAAAGFFVDLEISAQAPNYLTAAGFADCMARSVAQVDWWMSHWLFDTDYWHAPYLIQQADEIQLNKQVSSLVAGDIEAIASLYRVLTLCGLGISFTGVSNHGSMGEHQISHYIDCFAGEKHPGSLHGQQVGVACLTMARLQQMMLKMGRAPQVSATKFDFNDMSRRMGVKVAEQCIKKLQEKAFTHKTAMVFNQRINTQWSTLKRDLAPFIIPVAEMTRLLKVAGAPTSVYELGIPVEFYQEAVMHCHEMRNRFSFLDIAAHSGILKPFAQKEM